jgi:hypothetical protein
MHRIWIISLSGRYDTAPVVKVHVEWLYQGARVYPYGLARINV